MATSYLEKAARTAVAMEGHAMTGDVRLAKYFPDETFALTPEELH